MVKPAALVGQAVLYAAFAAVIGYFSTAPEYRHLPPDQALIKISFSHHGERVSECRRRTPEELARLAPNMRTPLDCPRERSPVTVQLELDGKLVYAGSAPPAGLSKDGVSTLYRRFPVPAGEHLLAVKMNDNVRIKEFNFQREEKVVLKPAQILVIDFNAEKGGIVLQ
ncbi:MAG: hypothetical protein ACOZCP_11360 [Pseudomonadota bacterium]